MYLEEIDIRTLPRTIKDAIECTHKLNLRYLWTDTLCILQGSADDKRNEIARMCDIYQDAYVTIIAASAQKVSQGFLQDRPDPVTTDLPFWCPDGKLGTISVREGESAPGMEPKEDSRTLHKAWRNILSDYTRRALTDPSDKLIAISGIAQLFQRYWGVGSRYIAGLWEHNLSGHLLWYRRSSSGKTLPIPKIYRAPSWSWAATNGCINAGPEMKTDNTLWEIRMCEAIPTIGSQCFGQIIGGKLEVEAIVKSVVWDPEEAELYELKQPEMKGNQAGLRKDGSQRHVGYVYLDGYLNSDSEGAANTGFAIVVGSSNTIGERVKHLSELLIVPADHTVGVFRRVGIFNANGTVYDDDDDDALFCDIDAWLSTPKQVVTIT
ncbi:hypothetical protein SERLADRAFT_442803 [Serpula lacrymans var. lacrymans S7.9]|uniref:Heterokaryon incompatibility domain-containing protein n=1 Tax=Serpula lacrymans var. lacrymans (strain S7.9) TaxID=578457 RepID=F8PA01_SERL9|nr:uncharacterized protein SERLADRAFT_442803 [Serpula lacrymans var. lacrymans S7.9]EGO19999.1 hypothetical protein SERLADRAFT_442803 [Serpula lacrymans var. lacrymans S7.9]